MREGSATAVCRHEGCGQRFTLSHHGNRTGVSGTRRRNHKFCSPRCSKAHRRREAALKAREKGGLVPGQDAAATAPAGARTLRANTASEIRTEWLQVHLHDEAPAIGSGLRLIAVDRVAFDWVHIRDHAGRTAKLHPDTYRALKPVAFGRSAAMEQYESRFPDATCQDDAAS